MNPKYKHIVHTGLYTNEAKDLIERVLKMIRAKRISTSNLHYAIDATKVLVQNDGEVTLCQENGVWLDSDNPFARPNDQAIRWLAFFIKRMVTWYIHDPATLKPVEWDDSSRKVSIQYDDSRHLSGISVGRLMDLYNALRRKTSFRDKAIEKSVKLLIGTRRDPITTEILNSRDNELEELEQSYKNREREIIRKRDKDKDDIYKKISEINQAAEEDMRKNTEDYNSKVLAIRSRYAELVRSFSASA